MENKTLSMMGKTKAELDSYNTYKVENITTGAVKELFEMDYELVVKATPTNYEVFEDFEELTTKYILVDPLFSNNLEKRTGKLADIVRDKINQIAYIETIDLEGIAYRLEDNKYVMYFEDEKVAYIINPDDRIKFNVIAKIEFEYQMIIELESININGRKIEIKEKGKTAQSIKLEALFKKNSNTQLCRYNGFNFMLFTEQGVNAMFEISDKSYEILKALMQKVFETKPKKKDAEDITTYTGGLFEFLKFD